METPRKRRTSISSASEVSGSETSSSSRNGRIVPLYNLHTHSHNLLSNSIHDAGTDAKIAKFHKNGVEVVNVGIFAPVEAWSSSSVLEPEDAPATCTSISFIEGPPPEPAVAEQPQPRKLLGKFFQAKPTPAVAVREPSPSPIPNHHPTFALAPVLGTTPTLFSRVVPPQGRAVAHTWMCKKWCKVGDGEDNWLVQAINLIGNDRCGVDIRVEWARGNRRDADTASRKSSSMSNLRADADAEIPPVPSIPQSPSEDRGRAPTATNLTIPRPPLFTRRKRSGGSSTGRTSDVSDESDPEDSEVPWVCTVVIHPSKLLSPHASPPSDEKTSAPLRLKVASLAPAPHHPKVVAQLKMQYPLPDVDLWNADLLPRKNSVPGTPGSAPAGRHILTAEEIKDVVCSTVMWVVVREGFSGLSKKVKPRLS